MGTHLIAFQTAATFGATLANITTVLDDIVSRGTANDRFLVPTDYRAIFAAAALGTTLTRALVTTPSLEVRREVAEVLPKRSAAVSFSLLAPEIFKPKRDIVLEGTEQLIMQSADSSGGGISKFGLIWLKAPGELPPVPEGDIRIVRATGTTTLGAAVWTSVTLTLDKDLEPGLYSLVGFIPMSVSVVAARAIITGQNYRPGMPGLIGTEAAASDFSRVHLQELMYYDMGHFAHTNIPAIQFLAAAADTVQTVFLYLVKIGSAPSGIPGQ